MPRRPYRKTRTSTADRAAKNRSTAADVYRQVSERIADALEAGRVPWSDFTTDRGRTRPMNMNGRHYRGANAVILHPALHGFRDSRWATFRQVKAAGGSVNKGAESMVAVFWKMHAVDDVDDAGVKTKRRIPLLRQYRVFNVADQTTGIELDDLPELAPDREHEPDQAAEQIVAGYLERGGPKIEHSRRPLAAYSPALDLVHMLTPERCTSAGRYYSVLLHELVHSTGHPSRLARGFGAGFGSEPYAAEELVAELGACFVLAAAGLEHLADHDSSAAYMAGWARAIRRDPKMFITAAGKAQRAADLILGATWCDDDAGQEQTASTPASPWPADRPNPRPKPQQPEPTPAPSDAGGLFA